MKNTEKHTKGEWKIDSDNGNIMSGEITVAIPHGSAGRIVDIKEEHDANAKLIAAAPEMLKRLKYVVSWLEDANVHKTFVKHFKDTIKKATE